MEEYKQEKSGTKENLRLDFFFLRYTEPGPGLFKTGSNETLANLNYVGGLSAMNPSFVRARPFAKNRQIKTEHDTFRAQCCSFTNDRHFRHGWKN